MLHDLQRRASATSATCSSRMLDMHTDPTAFTAAFGCHIVQTEADDLVRLLARRSRQPRSRPRRPRSWTCSTRPIPKSDPITREAHRRGPADGGRAWRWRWTSSSTRSELDGLAYYYEGEPDSETRQMVTNLIVGNSLLTAAGFPMCGESDLKTCIAMLIMDRLDIGGSFAEFHPIDFQEGFVLVGHDGPHHINIAEGKPVLRSLLKYHGKPGFGASVEFKIKEGPITMLSIGVTAQGKFKFVIAEGESVRGPIPPTGNTNTRGFFQPDVRTFLKRWVAEGPTHHFALGIGHHAPDHRRRSPTCWAWKAPWSAGRPDTPNRKR